MAAADGARARREGEVLHLEGRLDRAAAVALWPTLQALADGARALELGAIQALDSAGLALLAEAAARMRAGGQVEIRGDAPGLAELRAAYRLDPQLNYAGASP
ncbi:STAS domain-containing protein [Pseudoxanthomonas sp. SGD-10]|uniref:STAS domain-containing protein n=1 Tax=unclassified Pseudoxanthomonas TaxID=2645906 RepID=UPI00031044BB|nr:MULTISPECIES: STAS domain-containing protein [unclassified Pseudoxanthomonas]RRN78725.1 STAS domain-containing protein [Pseudoxanthomonas sp. SGD-10]